MEDNELQLTHRDALRVDLTCHNVRKETQLLLRGAFLFVPQCWRISCSVIRPAPPAATVACLLGGGLNIYYSNHQ